MLYSQTQEFRFSFFRRIQSRDYLEEPEKRKIKLRRDLADVLDKIKNEEEPK